MNYTIYLFLIGLARRKGVGIVLLLWALVLIYLTVDAIISL